MIKGQTIDPADAPDTATRTLRMRNRLEKQETH